MNQVLPVSAGRGRPGRMSLGQIGQLLLTSRHFQIRVCAEVKDKRPHCFTLERTASSRAAAAELKCSGWRRRSGGARERRRPGERPTSPSPPARCSFHRKGASCHLFLVASSSSSDASVTSRQAARARPDHAILEAMLLGLLTHSGVSLAFSTCFHSSLITSSSPPSFLPSAGLKQPGFKKK